MIAMSIGIEQEHNFTATVLSATNKIPTGAAFHSLTEFLTVCVYKYCMQRESYHDNHSYQPIGKSSGLP